MSTKRLLMITTGGTISGNTASTDINYREHVNDFKDIMKSTLDTIKEKWTVDVIIDTFELCDVDSSDITPSVWTDISNKIHKEYDNYESFLITHGTNTLGYTAAALSFSLENLNKPVVLTGSQVPFGDPGSDAIMNLQNAIRIAVWPYDEIKGVVVVFGSHIITGTRVKKSTEFDYDAFQSFTSSSIGRIGRIITITKENLDRHLNYLSKHSRIALKANNLNVKSKFDMRIASLTEFPGMSKDIIISLVNNNDIKGFILRAFGAGDPNRELNEAFEYLKEKRIPIIVTTQAPNGNANFQVNKPGQVLSAKELAIPAFDMSIEAITTKLAWLLAQNIPYNSFQEEMLKDLHGEINVIHEL